jgi:hypothetical protein
VRLFNQTQSGGSFRCGNISPEGGTTKLFFLHSMMVSPVFIRNKSIAFESVYIKMLVLLCQPDFTFELVRIIYPGNQVRQVLRTYQTAPSYAIAFYPSSSR